MADVTSNRGRHGSHSRERGQLILVTGLLVAVAMVALVLLLNTAIYTENLASRGTDQSGREAVEYRATVVGGVGGLIDAENEREHGTYGDARDNVTDGIDAVDNYTARSYAIDGTVVRINQSSSSLTIEQGQLIRQTDSSRRFRNESDVSDWTLATSVDSTRNFAITVDQTELVSTTASDAEDDGAFNITLSEGGDVWRVFVYEDSSEIAVATSTGGTPTEACTTSDTETTIDLTGSRIGEDRCPGLTWADGIGAPYDVSYGNGENATGTYNLTVIGTPAVNEHFDAVGTSPYVVPAVYSATFNISYETPTLTYRSEVRVAPGEPE